MQDKLSQAVGLYGQILDGQQAYTAQKLQEQQQRQYAQQQQSYGQYNPYQPQPPQQAGYDPRYAPPAQTNGYGYAPPSQAYQPPAATASGLYPAMPPQGGMYPTQPQGQAQYGYQPQYSPAAQAWQGQAAPQQYQPQQQYQPPQQQQYAHQPPLERHSSIRSVSSASHAQPQRQASGAYPSHPSADHTSLDPNAAQFVPSFSAGPSAPPVDMSTHPIASPSSAKSALPTHGLPGPNGSSYTSPSVTNGQLPQVSPQKQQYHQLPQPQQPQQQQPQHVYYDASFPPAPAAVFPDAPQSEFEQPQHSQTQGVEKQEKEEALLIEL